MNELLSSLLGVTIGSLVAWLVQRYYRRLDLTYALHTEFFGERMSRIRVEAYRLVPAIHGIPFGSLGTSMEDSIRLNCLWELLGYYQRVAVLTKNGEIQRRMVADLLGDNFTWWYTNVFKDQLRNTDWAAEQDIHWLWDWMVRSEERKGQNKKKRLETWIKRADTELKVILKPKILTSE